MQFSSLQAVERWGRATINKRWSARVEVGGVSWKQITQETPCFGSFNFVHYIFKKYIMDESVEPIL